MTISVTTAYAGPFAGNGSTTAFPFTFKVMSASEIEVRQTIAGVESVVAPTAYTVSLSAGEGGTVNYITPPATGTSIVLVSAPDFSQAVSFENSGAFLPSVVDAALDRMAIRDNALDLGVTRALKAPMGETPATVPAAADRAGMVLGFDNLGQPIAVSNAGVGAAISQTQASTAVAAALAAALSAAAAQAAAGGLYATTAAGITGTTNGQYFLVVGTGNTYANLYKNVAGVATSQNLAIPSKAFLDSLFDTTSVAERQFALSDPNGNSIPLGSSAGYQYSFGLPECDAIGYLGDSIGEAAYVLKDKAWLSIVAALSPWRLINLSVSGDTTAKVCERLADNRETIVLNTSWNIAFNGGTSRSALNMRYAIFGLGVNDFAVGTPADWVQNLPKAIEMVKAWGAQPAILTEAEAVTATYEWDLQVLGANMARRYGADWIDVRSFKDELGAPVASSNPLWVGVHPGTRTGYIYALSVLNYLRSLPPPKRSIKVYNLRSTIAVGTLADLVFDTGDALATKFKDISLGHKYINTSTQDRFEELDKVAWVSSGQPADTLQSQHDQYTWLAAGGQLTLTDYALVRVSLPAHARTIEGVALELGTNATEAYVLDKFASNTAGTDTPPGAWVQQTISGRLIPIKREQLQRSMRGNELYVLLHKAGGVTFAAPIVHWSGTESVEPRLVRTYHSPGPELLTTQLFSSLTGWTVTGSPAIVIPWDLAFGAPRQPGTNTAITAVAEVTATNKLGQSKVLTATSKDFVHYRLRVMPRYFPKVLLDRTATGYTGFDAAQVLDRSTGKSLADSAIGYDTLDMKTLRLTTAINASGVGTPNPYESQDQLVGLYYTPIDFIVTVPKAAHRAGATLNWELSGPDGAVQLAWVSQMEVVEHVTRA